MSDLKVMFNRGGYVERAIAERYACCVYESRVVRFPDVVGPVRVSTIGWRDDVGALRFYAQCFQTESGDFLPGSALDPKYLFADDGLHYKIGRPPPPS
jgi:hypothetical protein